MITPSIFDVVSKIGVSLSTSNLNRCSKVPRKSSISILARCAPRHARPPKIYVEIKQTLKCTWEYSKWKYS